MYKIVYALNLEKALKKIPKKDAKTIVDKIESLAENPRPRWVEKLKTSVLGFSPLRYREISVQFAGTDSSKAAAISANFFAESIACAYR